MVPLVALPVNRGAQAVLYVDFLLPYSLTCMLSADHVSGYAVLPEREMTGNERRTIKNCFSQ